MTETASQKGRLELILDEFSEVHGTVLMGMHKELQTLKHDVDIRVETRIAVVLEKMQAADSTLEARIISAEALKKDISQISEELAHRYHEYRTKMEGALKVADKLNTESQQLLRGVKARGEELHEREISLQVRTRRVVIGVGLAILVGLGASAWLLSR